MVTTAAAPVVSPDVAGNGIFSAAPVRGASTTRRTARTAQTLPTAPVW